MGPLLEVILPVFLVIGFGFIAVKRDMFAPEWADGLMKFTQNFAIPCLLFQAISTLDLATYFDPRLLVSYYAPAIILFALAIIVARKVFARPMEDCVAIGFCCLFGNAVLLGLPITERAYGSDALDANFGIISLNAPICYLIGIATMETVRNSGASVIATVGQITRAIFRNPLVIGLLLGFVVNVSGQTPPTIIMDAVDLMARAALPAAVFGLGGILAQYRLEGDAGVVAMITVSALVLHPALTWGMGRGLDLDEPSFRSALITAAMAPGVNGYVFANMYGVAKRVAASAVLVSTAMSVLTVWVWLAMLGG